MRDVVPESSRACRDYRVKFPDDVLHESLAGQLWFGAEVYSRFTCSLGAKVMLCGNWQSN